MARIASSLRQKIAAAAQYRCGYCKTQEPVIGMPLEIDHIVPEGFGGDSAESNLWLACPRCNRYKGMQTHGHDPITGEEFPLFHPRKQQWEEHFQWTQGGLYIDGRTPIGRATVHALNMNNAYIVRARSAWIKVGWHPPDD
jgi:hypothetical protein